MSETKTTFAEMFRHFSEEWACEVVLGTRGQKIRDRESIRGLALKHNAVEWSGDDEVISVYFAGSRKSHEVNEMRAHAFQHEAVNYV